MKTFLSIILLAGIAVGCNNNKPAEKVNKEQTLSETKTESGTCYVGTSGKDTIRMVLRKDGELVSGELDYLFYEKDKSRGRFDGRMKGDTLFADYVYSSEGVQSTREIAFLQSGNTLTEGYADAMEIDGKMTFRNPNKVKFGSSFVLTETECK
jgi:hypothetical protein